MDEKQRILRENITEYYELGLFAFKQKKFNSATSLFFKAIASLGDLIILQKTGVVPSSHTDRFRILEQKFPDLYALFDRDFPFYQDSYTKKMDKESAELLKEDAEKLAKDSGI